MAEVVVGLNDADTQLLIEFDDAGVVGEDRPAPFAIQLFGGAGDGFLEQVVDDATAVGALVIDDALEGFVARSAQTRFGRGIPIRHRLGRAQGPRSDRGRSAFH